MPLRPRKRLIIFTRYPEAGTTKTRMIPELGAAGAAELQRQMTEHIRSRVDELRKLHQLTVEVRYEGGSEKRMTEWLGPGFSYCHQGSGDIGHADGTRTAGRLWTGMRNRGDYRIRYPGYHHEYHAKSV